MIKKSIVLIGITFTLFAVVLSGCNEQSSDNESTSKFIGTWKSDMGNETWTFYTNKTLKKVINLYEEPIKSIFNWEDKDDELCIMPQSNPSNKRCGSYEFTTISFTWTISENNNRTFYKV